MCIIVKFWLHRIVKYYTSLRLILLTGKVGRDFLELAVAPELTPLLQQGLRDIRWQGNFLALLTTRKEDLALLGSSGGVGWRRLREQAVPPWVTAPWKNPRTWISMGWQA